jgi:hypothetical protein
LGQYWHHEVDDIIVNQMAELKKQKVNLSGGGFLESGQKLGAMTPKPLKVTDMGIP